MPKGRGSNPSTEHIGNWYRHNTCADYTSIGSRRNVTSTGAMLDTTGVSKQTQPAAPPNQFDQKSQVQYDQLNPFSNHDNRNLVQLKGEYLGNGRDTRVLGRHIASDDQNQHRSEISSFLKHHGRQVTDSFFHSNYMISHDTKTPIVSLPRRFPKKYKVCEPTSTKGSMDVGGADNISSQTLVSSLEPYARHNSWKYTYHNHNKYDIYPKAWGDRCSVHLPEQKPRKRNVVVGKINRECTTCT